MASDRHGERVDLRWDGTPAWWAYRGHGLDAEELREDVRGWYEEEDETPPASLPVREQWARWLFAWPLEDGCTRTLQTYSQPSRGAFRVTVVSDGDEEERLKVLRVAEAEGQARARETVLARWPGVEVVKVVGGLLASYRALPGQPGVEFRFPGGQGRAHWVLGDDFVSVENRDHDAWRAYVASLEATP